MSKRPKRWYMASVVAVNADGEGRHSIAYVAARGRDEAVGLYVTECLRERPSFLIQSAVAGPAPRGNPRPSTGATPSPD